MAKMEKVVTNFIQKDIKRSKQTQRNFWFAECPYCGQIFSARLSDLKSGHTKSCGCQSYTGKKKKHNIIKGMIFGYLTIIKETKKDSSRRGFFLCQCQCGNLTEVRRDMLISGNTVSCGCKRFQSKGQKLIKILLQQNNIPFVKQKTFESCRFPDTNALARFDFYVNNSYIIEFDGQQHFSYKKTGWNDKQHFLKVKQHDDFKNQWCQKNNIPLIRIPYWQLQSLSLKDLLLPAAVQSKGDSV